MLLHVRAESSRVGGWRGSLGTTTARPAGPTRRRPRPAPQTSATAQGGCGGGPRPSGPHATPPVMIRSSVRPAAQHAGSVDGARSPVRYQPSSVRGIGPVAVGPHEGRGSLQLDRPLGAGVAVGAGSDPDGDAVECETVVRRRRRSRSSRGGDRCPDDGPGRRSRRGGSPATVPDRSVRGGWGPATRGWRRAGRRRRCAVMAVVDLESGPREQRPGDDREAADVAERQRGRPASRRRCWWLRRPQRSSWGGGDPGVVWTPYGSSGGAEVAMTTASPSLDGPPPSGGDVRRRPRRPPTDGARGAPGPGAEPARDRGEHGVAVVPDPPSARRGTPRAARRERPAQAPGDGPGRAVALRRWPSRNAPNAGRGRRSMS